MDEADGIRPGVEPEHRVNVTRPLWRRPPSAPPGGSVSSSVVPRMPGDPETLPAPLEKDRRCALAEPPWAKCALRFHGRKAGGRRARSVGGNMITHTNTGDYNRNSSDIANDTAQELESTAEEGTTDDCGVLPGQTDRVPASTQPDMLQVVREAGAGSDRDDCRTVAAISRILGHSEQRSSNHQLTIPGGPCSGVASPPDMIDVQKEEKHSPTSASAELSAQMRLVRRRSATRSSQRKNTQSSSRSCAGLLIETASADCSRSASPSGPSTKANRTTKIARPATATVTRGRTASTVHEMHINRLLARKLKAFDRRFVYSASHARGNHEEPKVDEDHEPHIESVCGLEAASQSVADKMDFLQADRPALKDEEVDGKGKRTNLSYEIVKWSCQKPDCRADSLKKIGGRWETIPGKVRNEWVIFELGGGKVHATVSGIEFKLPGCDYAPHMCAMEYSQESATGPWVEAWRFEVAAREETSLFSTFDYLKIVEDFKHLLLLCFQGGVEEAWQQILDINGDGKLSSSEFTHAMLALREIIKALPKKKKAQVQKYAHLFREPQKLFLALDVDKSGAVELKDLQLEDGWQCPEAPWWKLTILSNWGNPTRLQVLGPVVLTQKVKPANYTELGKCFRNDFSMFGYIQDKAKAFDTTLLGVDPQTMNVRRLAKKYNIAASLAEAAYSYFKQVDTDNSGIIEEFEFRKLLLKIHGTADESDLPQNRVAFFWKQADGDGSGTLDFEEFLQWFIRYFAGDSQAQLHGIVNWGAIVGSLYHSLARARFQNCL